MATMNETLTRLICMIGFPKLISHKETDETAEFIINVSSEITLLVVVVVYSG